MNQFLPGIRQQLLDPRFIEPAQHADAQALPDYLAAKMFGCYARDYLGITLIFNRCG
jgi:hypothetical protein